MDRVSPTVRSQTMRAVKGKNTSLEMIFRRALWEAGVRGWRLHRQTLPGRPDLVFSRAYVAIFIDSCFWHGCPRHLRMPKSNLNYWAAKIARNRSKDSAVTEELKSSGWFVLRFWEHEIREDLNRCISKVKNTLARRDKSFI